MPDADIGNAWIKVDSGEQMMGHLRNMPRVEVEKKLKVGAVQAVPWALLFATTVKLAVPTSAWRGGHDQPVERQSF